MNKLLNQAWKHRYGIMGTLFLHFGFVMYSRNAVVSEYYSRYEETEDAFVMDFSEPEIIEEVQEKELDESGNIINKTFAKQDERAENDQQYDARFNKSKVDEQIYNELKELEKQTFNQLSKEKGEIVEKTAQTDPVEKKTEPDKSKEEKNSSSGSIKGTTTADYDLGGRRHEGGREIPKPSYTCIGSGTLVVNIEVNRSGKVVSAIVDKTASSFTEECMKTAAEYYAKKVKFEASSSSPEPQRGTITYRYVAQ
jgi:hypothetical protein